MAAQPTAKDLMAPNFIRLGASHTLREALAVLLDPSAPPRKEPRAIIAVGPDGEYAGMLYYLAILRVLHEALDPGDAPAATTDRPAAGVEALGRPLAAVVDREVPAVEPATPLASLLQLAAAHDVEFFPVLEDQRVVGVVSVGAIFKAAADLALTPETSGIRLG